MKRAALAVLFWALLSCSFARATATVHSGNLVLFTGDSITAAGYPTVSGGLVDQINAQIPTVTTPRYATLAPGARAATLASGARAATVASVSTHIPIRVVNTGVAGNVTADIAAAVPARITNYNPDIVVILIGINDLILAVSPATTAANYDSILSQIRSWSSTVEIVVMSVLWYGEQWAAGPVWSNSPSYDAGIDSLNTTIQGLCVTYGATYVPIRPQALTYETINNSPAPGAFQGVLTQDRLHPNATGQAKMGDWAIGSFAIVP